MEALDGFLAPIRVDLAGKLADGKPPTIELRPLSPLEWASLGRGFPISSAKPSEDDLADTEEIESRYGYVRNVVAKAIIRLRVVSPKDEDGVPVLREEWLSVRCVIPPKDPDRSRGEFSIDQFDRRDNVTRCWNALLRDLDEGGPLAEANTFLEGGSS